MNKIAIVTKKARYEKPLLVSHGTIEQITKGGAVGGTLDATFPTGTPFGDLTFS